MAVVDYVIDHLGWIFGETVRCVREPGACVSTVQFWVAVGTGIGLVVGFARWMTLKVKKNTLEDRLERIEGHVDGRGGGKSSGGDCDLVRAHRTLFTRPAFTRSCIQELSILLLADVVDETIAALGTGKHYDDGGKVRAEFADLHGYKEKTYQAHIRDVYQRLQELQWSLKDLDQFLRKSPVVDYPTREFISAGLEKRLGVALWEKILEKCDRVDSERNGVIEVFNKMLRECGEAPLPTICLSSKQVG